MVFDPYKQYDLPECQKANLFGTVYGVSKAAFLVYLGSNFSTPALISEKYAPIIFGILGLGTLTLAALTAFHDWKAEHSIAQMYVPAFKEEKARANWVAYWTCYCFAAAIYGNTKTELFIRDLKISALKISKLAVGICAGLTLVYLLPNSDGKPDWKLGVSSGIALSGCIAYFFMFVHETLPEITAQARCLLEGSVEIYAQERQPLRVTALTKPAAAFAAGREPL
ncbi:MAG: hypothetical protein LLG04_13175 [Parachlamydia sp.]|nr:hypothetical protein [Parachlamydia sp.]